ncbi:PepSY domain-containing protein [Candidatus Contendibacter odensensis]|uniref:Propeptide PepSY amd peptidase M4 n=1 Tax=Candidatus Contendobacter odensis Run_B_J11 TaxID=1400861 RepID=A0A7U7J3A3_9GAMM|nr:PepSY domain-containing protein [Candidatus Contendobacter odensis]MBK8755360.1 PepSY domain-containing protein [Candidatus Competibacteraceae bacterium]CDH43993.1 Propeptide PepSY amd peptidase M4 [Candidatus Contendobacter odensis Run_B_J11]
MIVRKPLLAAVTLAIAFATTAAFAATPVSSAPATSQPAAAITKEQATEMALKAHPGKVTKAYEDTHKGKQTWEVKITGDDGKKWEVYYEIATGALVDAQGK